MDKQFFRDNIVYINGVAVPRLAQILTAPDTTRSCGYYRLLHLVDQHVGQWCVFDMDSEKMAKRVKYRINSKKQLNLGARYALIQVGPSVYLKLREGHKPTGEAGEFYGNVREDERVVSGRKSLEDTLAPTEHEVKAGRKTLQALQPFVDS